ncbi:MAG: S-layer homology domain-containing protein [Peptoniphilus harei]|nr:S-layer homology domain-containing protein [Peptoniphilus harei]
MKKILILMIILLAMPFGVFAAKEDSVPLSVSAVKENENYNFEIKNAKANELVEIEVKIQGNDVKSKVTKNVLSKNNKKYISITQNELDSLVGPSTGYTFRLRFAKKDGNSKFTNELNLGKAPIFRNYSNWAYKDLLNAEELKLFSKEVASNTRGKITREEFAEIAVKAYEIKYKRSSQGSVKHFKDTDNKYVNMACDLGIMNGKDKDKFAPKDNITREDYAVVIANLFKLENSKKIKIKDAKKISDYAIDAVNKALSDSYLNLDSKKNFNPKNQMKREEVISSIVRHI